MTTNKIDSSEVLQRLDNDEFWQLVRKFATSAAGEPRASRKQALLMHVAKVLDSVENHLPPTTKAWPAEEAAFRALGYCE